MTNMRNSTKIEGRAALRRIRRGGTFMRDLLAEIVEKKRGIVAAAKRDVPLETLKKDIKCGTFRMAEHFRRHGWGMIDEIKVQ